MRMTPQDLRNPRDSKFTLSRIEDAADCYGEACGNYHEENGIALKPRPHSHLIVTGREPATAPRRYAISK